MQSDAVLQAMYDVYANDTCDESMYMQTMQAMKVKYAMQEMQAMRTVQASVASEARYASTASDASGGAGIGAGQHAIKRETKKQTHAECRIGSVHN